MVKPDAHPLSGFESRNSEDGGQFEGFGTAAVGTGGGGADALLSTLQSQLRAMQVDELGPDGAPKTAW